MSMPSNTAAWLDGWKASLEVRPAPYTAPAEDELVIKNGAVAINPIDWIAQESGNLTFPWIKHPFIMGTDVAGEVVQAGSSVASFKVGDRVLSHCVGANKKYNTPTKGAFQAFTVGLPQMTSHIPDRISYESASVLPLGLSTAACGLFQKDHLALSLPPSSGTAPPTSETVLIWSGASSVGSNAIQLAIAAGYQVITTASLKNFEYVKSLGASEAFNYSSRNVVPDIIDAFKDRKLAGAISIGHGAAETCLDILHHCDGNRFLSMASYPTPPKPFTSLVLPRTMWYMGTRLLKIWYKSWSRGISVKFIFGESLVDNDLGKLIYNDFLPAALEDSRFMPAPQPLVVGRGLESVQRAFDVQKRGVSAKKVVVTL